MTEKKKHKHEEEVSENEEIKAEVVATPEDTSSEVEQLSAEIDVLKKKLEEYVPVGVKMISQGEIVAKSLVDYLKRHPEIADKCSRNGKRQFFTTDSTEDFDNHATSFFGQALKAAHLDLADL